MDLILFIIALVFRSQQDVKHNYVPLIALSIFGAVISLCLIPTCGLVTLLDVALYGITLGLSIAAPNKEVEEA